MAQGAVLLLTIATLSWCFTIVFPKPFYVSALGSVCITAILMIASMKMWTSFRVAKSSPEKRHAWWQKQVVLLTGSSSGVGLALAEGIIQRKPRSVILVDVTPCPDHIISLARDKNVRLCVPDPCNLADTYRIDNMLDQVKQDLDLDEDGPTILINNAGMVNGDLFLQLKWSAIAKLFQVNTLAPMYLTKAILPRMITRDQGACIVNMASVLGNSGASRVSDYCASKAAVISWHESLRQEVNELFHHVFPCPIRMILVTPGLIGSTMFAGVKHHFPWITPILPVDYVATRILCAIESPELGHVDISMPFYTHFVPLIRLLPPWLGDWVRQCAGANDDMLTFRKG